MAPHEGNCVSATPWARSCFKACAAVNRVKATVLLKVGSCCACASANVHSACATSGNFSSQRLPPLRADCAPTQINPLRFSASPVLTVSRPHPISVSACRALPWQYLSVISATNARRAEPTIFVAANLKSSIADGVRSDGVFKKSSLLGSDRLAYYSSGKFFWVNHLRRCK